MEILAEVPQAPSIGADIDAPENIGGQAKGKKKKKKKKKQVTGPGNLDLGNIDNLLNQVENEVKNQQEEKRESKLNNYSLPIDTDRNRATDLKQSDANFVNDSREEGKPN